MVIAVLFLLIIVALVYVQLARKEHNIANKKNLKYLLLVVCCAICLPFVIHCIASSNFNRVLGYVLGENDRLACEMPQNAYNTWVLFFGSFSGAIIGVMGAWATARYNIERQNKVQKEQRELQVGQYKQQLELQYSSYIAVEDLVGQIDLFNWGITGAMKEYRILDSQEYIQRRQYIYQKVISGAMAKIQEKNNNKKQVAHKELFDCIDEQLQKYNTMWYQKVCNYGPNIVYDFYIEIEYQLTAFLDRVQIFNKPIVFQAYLEGLPVKENMVIPLKSFLEEEEKSKLAELIPQELECHQALKEQGEHCLDDLVHCDIYVTHKRIIYKELSGKCVEVNYSEDQNYPNSPLKKEIKEITAEQFEDEIRDKRRSITWTVVNEAILNNRRQDLFNTILNS